MYIIYNVYTGINYLNTIINYEFTFLPLLQGKRTDFNIQ